MQSYTKKNSLVVDSVCEIDTQVRRHCIGSDWIRFEALSVHWCRLKRKILRDHFPNVDFRDAIAHSNTVLPSSDRSLLASVLCKFTKACNRDSYLPLDPYKTATLKLNSLYCLSNHRILGSVSMWSEDICTYLFGTYVSILYWSIRNSSVLWTECSGALRRPRSSYLDGTGIEMYCFVLQTTVFLLAGVLIKASNWYKS